MDDKIKKALDHQKPFNLSLLNLNQGELYRSLNPVKSTQMFTGANYQLHPEGLWSNEIFGAMGSPERMTKQAYIDLNVEIIHPVVYRELISSSSLLEEIMDGVTFAKWNPETKFFDKSNALDGETGYDFFMQHLDELVMPETNSPKRKELNELLKKHRRIYKLDKFIVLQAGYRDVEFKEGMVDHDEINQIYRELISLANSLSSVSTKMNLSAVNSTRNAIQKTALKLYMYLGEITGHGKKKLIQGKWASRTVANGTANVITAVKPSGRFLNDKANIGFNDTMVGLFQQLVGCLPFSVRGIKNSFLAEKFVSPLEPVRLVNKKTLKSEEVNLSQQWHDLFQSDEGIKKLIQRFRPTSVRHNPVEVDGRYLALIYKGEDGTFKILNGIEELPKDKSRELVTPLTFIELLYITTIHLIDNAPSSIVRYPITGIESNVPSFAKVMTTTKAEKRRMLNDDWEIDETIEPFYQFPVNGADTVTSLCPPLASLGPQGGDFESKSLILKRFL